MRKVMISAVMAASVMAPMAQADSLEQAFEPAAMFKLDFGGKAAPEAGFALRLNYSSAVRQSLARLTLNPETAAQALTSRSRSNLFGVPALGQLDFNRNGFRSATLVGLPLVTRHVRNQTDEAADGSAAEVAADASAEGAPAEDAPAEDASWYDYGAWGWKGWTMAAVGTAGIVYLATDDDDDSSAPAPTEPPPADEECIPGPDPLCI